MDVIQAIKIGNTINLSVNGVFKQVKFEKLEEANKVFAEMLKIRENPTPENMIQLKRLLNEKTRFVALSCGKLGDFEIDTVDNNIYLCGFNTPIPEKLYEIIKEYHENNFPLKSIINFWKLLMANPDVRVRENLFDFLTDNNFVLTENGYFVTYKAVMDFVEKNKSIVDNELIKFVKEKYNQVKNVWKKSTKNFTIYKKDYKYFVAETNKFRGDADSIGLLSDLYISITSEDEVIINDTSKTYTDKHTGKMRIKLGIPVKQERKTCVGDPSIECGSSLHSGHVKYVKNFANSTDTVLCCLINPTHVIAVPKYDNTKLRSCEYFPLCVINDFQNFNLNNQQSFFESDYVAYEKEELEEMIKSIKINQLPIESAINSEKENRSMDELLKIIEGRLIFINL